MFIATMDLFNSADVSGPAFEISIRTIQEARQAIRLLQHASRLEDEAPAMILECATHIVAPAVVRPKGRPPHVRIKSRSETYGNKKSRSLPRPDQGVDADNDVNPEEVEFLTPSGTVEKHKIKCSTCGVPGHNRATCGRKRGRENDES